MRIEVFSGTDAGDDAVIVGLKIHYKMLDGNEKIASHGLVHADPVGDFSISGEWQRQVMSNVSLDHLTS